MLAVVGPNNALTNWSLPAIAFSENPRIERTCSIVTVTLTIHDIEIKVTPMIALSMTNAIARLVKPE